MGIYHGDVAVAAYLHGELSKDQAEKVGFQSKLREEWLNLKWEKGRQPNAQDWTQLVADHDARVAAKIELERTKAVQALIDEAKRFADRTDKLTPAAIAGLQSAKQGRTASLGKELPGIVVKLADDPAYDSAIIEHTWARHALALSEKVERSRLRVVNLFPDPVGDAIFEEVQRNIGKASINDAGATKVLMDMLTGKQPFDGTMLSSALEEAQGQTFYIVSHIPEAQSGRGQLEFGEASKPVLTAIDQLEAAFQAAKVNLFIVGCSSSKHASMGLSKDINNVDALSNFLSALQSGTSRNLFEWHAAFAADALVVIDPLASEAFSRDAAERPLSGVTLVTDGRTVSHGYVGTYAVPASTQGVSATPSVALAVAAGQLTPPQPCSSDPSPSQLDAAERFAPQGMVLLILTLGTCMILSAMRETANEGNDFIGSLLMLVFAGSPILISAYNWPTGSGDFAPGPWLGIWCLLYAAVFGMVGLSEKKRLNVKCLIAGALAVCAALFGASYFGFMADPNIRAFCDAFAPKR